LGRYFPGCDARETVKISEDRTKWVLRIFAGLANWGSVAAFARRVSASFDLLAAAETVFIVDHELHFALITQQIQSLLSKLGFEKG
jgi:hypothetical protein